MYSRQSTRIVEMSKLNDPCYVNAMVHFYRGELARIMVWRQRLDVTTTWAITSSTTIITVAFSFREIPHIIFFFNLAFVWTMLWIEARRYRFYDAFRGRVRMLESNFLVPMLSRSKGLLEGEWRRLVCEDLVIPCFKISRLEAICRRMKRNYMYIFCIVLLAWILKIFMHANVSVHSFRDLLSALNIEGLPSWFIELVLAGSCLSFVTMAFYAMCYSSEEVAEFGSRSTSTLWRL